tara:strand:+ start:11 stop:277 length:267 start_codon:yes stop_codon:yes gene_type:complete
VKQLACQFRLLLRFFGLDPSSKLDIHQSIFYFIYSAPGFTFGDVYNMPVHLKNFYLREFMDFKKKEKEHIDKSQPKPQPTIPRRFNPK